MFTILLSKVCICVEKIRILLTYPFIPSNSSISPAANGLLIRITTPLATFPSDSCNARPAVIAAAAKVVIIDDTFTPIVESAVITTIKYNTIFKIEKKNVTTVRSILLLLSIFLISFSKSLTIIVPTAKTIRKIVIFGKYFSQKELNIVITSKSFIISPFNNML